MTLIKQITVECTECNYSDIVSDSENHYEETRDLDKCPKCGSR